jgi:hypothetical protein
LATWQHHVLHLLLLLRCLLHKLCLLYQLLRLQLQLHGLLYQLRLRLLHGLLLRLAKVCSLHLLRLRVLLRLKLLQARLLLQGLLLLLWLLLVANSLLLSQLLRLLLHCLRLPLLLHCLLLLKLLQIAALNRTRQRSWLLQLLQGSRGHHLLLCGLLLLQGAGGN